MSEFNDQMISKIRRIQIVIGEKYSVTDTKFELGIFLINHNIVESKVFIMSQANFEALKQTDIDQAHLTVEDYADCEIPINNFTYIEDKLYVDVDDEYIDFDIYNASTLIAKNQYKGNCYEYPRIIVLTYDDNNLLDDDFEMEHIGIDQADQTILKRLIISNDSLKRFAEATDRVSYKKLLEDFEITAYRFNKKEGFIHNVCTGLSVPESELVMEDDVIRNNLYLYLQQHPKKRYKIESMELIDEHLFIDFKDSYKFDYIVDYSFGIGISPFKDELIFPSIIILIEGDDKDE